MQLSAEVANTAELLKHSSQPMYRSNWVLTSSVDSQHKLFHFILDAAAQRRSFRRLAP